MPLSRDDGVTLVEAVVASALSMLLLAAIFFTLETTYKTQVFSQRETQALNDAHNAVAQLQHDFVGATSVGADPACPTTCMAVSIPGSGYGDTVVRHRLVGSQLKRDIWDSGLGAYINERVLTESLANLSQSPTVPLFTCSSASGLVAVKLALVVRPHSSKPDTFRLNTTIRPRNTFVPGC